MAGLSVRRELARKALFKSSQLVPASRELLARGTQVLYVPQHAGGDLLHADVEAGFVTRTSVSFAFCRYWRKQDSLQWYNLRTKANSEATGFDGLFIVDTVRQDIVNRALEEYC